MRVATSLSLIIVSLIVASFVLNHDDASSDVKLASSSDLDWGAFNAQLSHDWYY